MSNKIIGALAVLAALVLPGAAIAATAVATTDVNLRAGPSTQYPAVDVVRNGDAVFVFGCLANRSWCDVGYTGQRGWMSSNYLAYVDGGYRYTGPRVVSSIAAPVVSFSFGNYWDDHYRHRRFYRDRDRWDRHDDWRDNRKRRTVRDRRDRNDRVEQRRDTRRDSGIRGEGRVISKQKADVYDPRRLRRHQRD